MTNKYRVIIPCPFIHDAIIDFAERSIEYDIPEVEQQLAKAELLELIDRYERVLAGDDTFTE